MRKIAIYTGIILLPFYEIITMLMIPHDKLTFFDTRIPREVLSLNIALFVGLIALYKGELAPFRNKFFLMLVGFALLAISQAPHYGYIINGARLGPFWYYKPLFIMLVFILFTSAMIKMELHFDFERITSIFIYIGLAMGVYVLLQLMGYDQFSGVLRYDNPDTLYTPMTYLGGSLGNPTIVSPFLALIVPFCLRKKQYIYGAFITLCVFMTQSDIAIAALIIGMTFYLLSISKRLTSAYIILLTILMVVGGYLIIKDSPILSKVNDSGRFHVWQEIVKDVNTPIQSKGKVNYALTGKGIGSYQYVFPGKVGTRFHEPHNSILWALHDLGIVGAVLLILSLIWHIQACLKGIYKDIYWKNNLVALTSSSIIIILCSFGTILIHLGIFWFYFSVIIALLYGTLNHTEGNNDGNYSAT